jgi:hypothetical protein
MLLESPISVHVQPPRLRLKRKCAGALSVGGCFIRVSRRDSDLSGRKPAPLRSPLQARPYGGIPWGPMLGGVLINRQPNADLDAPPNVRYWG